MTTTKKEKDPEVSPKSTKDQILAAYNEVLSKLSEKQLATPEEQKKQKDKEEVVVKAFVHSADAILTDLSGLKSKAIKQIDNLSEQLLAEFDKFTNLREAIVLEQKHLEELYQIKETVSTLSALIQTQTEAREEFQLEMKQTKQAFDQDITLQKTEWQKKKEQLELDYKEQKERLEKIRKNEEEDYNYKLTLKRRNDADEYNNKKVAMEKELSELKENLLKREAEIAAKEKDYQSLKEQVEQIPGMVKEAVSAAEESLRNQMLQKHNFENKLRQQEYEGTLKLNEQKISSLEEKISKQEALIKEVTVKADMASQSIESIAVRALDTSAQRYISVSPNSSEKERSLSGN